MSVILEDGKLTLSGFVGGYYFDDGFTSSDVVIALSQIEDDEDLTVYINSPGGIATEGAAIHAILARRTGATNVVIDGTANSAASLIAMVGQTVTMSAGAVMMIHDPAGSTFGNSADHAKQIECLEALATAYSRIYAGKSRKSPEECREIMKSETWLTPEEAVAAGFADTTTETPSAPVAAFDYRVYAHAPQHLVALSRSKNWSLSEADRRAVMSAASPPPRKEPSMTDKERADQLAAENTQLRTDLESARSAGSSAQACAAEVADICMQAGVPAMASSLIREGATVDQARARASSAQDIKNAVAMARQSCPTMSADLADQFIASGMTMDQVRSKLFEQMTGAQAPATATAHQPGGTPPAGGGTVDLVATMKQRVGAR